MLQIFWDLINNSRFCFPVYFFLSYSIFFSCIFRHIYKNIYHYLYIHENRYIKLNTCVFKLSKQINSWVICSLPPLLLLLWLPLNKPNGKYFSVALSSLTYRNCISSLKWSHRRQELLWPYACLLDCSLFLWIVKVGGRFVLTVMSVTKLC